MISMPEPKVIDYNVGTVHHNATRCLRARHGATGYIENGGRIGAMAHGGDVAITKL